MKRISVPEEHSEFAEWYEQGYERGLSCASWCDMPQVGDRIDKNIDWIGYGDTVTDDNIRDYHETIAFVSEENDRQYSPFEFTAHEINELGEWQSDSAWQAFDDGIAAGIHANLSERYNRAA